jgi:WD40 repeat protein
MFMISYFTTFQGHQNPVYALSNSAKAGIFFSGGNDKGIVEWSLSKMAFVKVKMPVQSSVYAIHNLNERMFVGERSGAFSVYNFINQAVEIRVNAHLKPIFDIKTINYKNELISSSEDGTVAIWSLTDFKEVKRITVSHDTVRSIAISPDEQQIAFACKDGVLRIFETEHYTLLHELKQHSLGITAVAYHPQGKYLISGGRDAQLNVWSLPNYSLVKTIPAHLNSIYEIVFHPSYPIFATCSLDKSIKIWDADLFKLYKKLSKDKLEVAHSHSVNKIAWSTDGNYLISTGDDRNIIIWKLEY